MAFSQESILDPSRHRLGARPSRWLLRLAAGAGAFVLVLIHGGLPAGQPSFFSLQPAYGEERKSTPGDKTSAMLKRLKEAKAKAAAIRAAGEAGTATGEKTTEIKPEVEPETAEAIADSPDETLPAAKTGPIAKTGPVAKTGKDIPAAEPLPAVPVESVAADPLPAPSAETAPASPPTTAPAAKQSRTAALAAKLKSLRDKRGGGSGKKAVKEPAPTVKSGGKSPTADLAATLKKNREANKKKSAKSATAKSATQVAKGTSAPALLFGSREKQSRNLKPFPKWTGVLDRYFSDKDLPKSDCESSKFNDCHLADWQAFLNGIKDKDKVEQISSVNDYMNNVSYINEPKNYQIPDHWATPGQFFNKNGDCEDYAIAKFMSLRALGFTNDEMRIVVLQDLNLKIPHAILAVYVDGQPQLLDNQIKKVVPAKSVFHYKPIYSMNEESWWLHKN